MPGFVDLRSQVQKILRREHGGTENDRGIAEGVYVRCTNNSGATLAIGSVVRLFTSAATNYNGFIVKADTEEGEDVVGIVIGRFIASGDDQGVFEAVAPANGDTAAVLTAGTTYVLTSGTITKGEYAYVAPTDGYAKSLPTRKRGAFGVFVSGGAAVHLVRLPLSATATGSETTSQYAVEEVADLARLDFADSLNSRANAGSTIAAVEVEPSRLFVDALQVKVADAGGIFAAPSPASGTETLRPTSDAAKSGTIVYSSGSTGWNLVDEAVLDTADYYEGSNDGVTPWYLVHGFPASALDASKRITSITITANVSEQLGGGVAQLLMRDPQTGDRVNVHDFDAGTENPATVTLTTRPWDGHAWTIDDLRHLQAGAGQSTGAGNSTRVRQFYIEVNWTAPKTVESVLAQFLSLGGPGNVVAHGNFGATETIDHSAGTRHWGTLNADCTFSFTGWTDLKDCALILELIQDGTGGWTPTLSGVTWIGPAPTWDTTPGTTTLVGLMSRDGGATIEAGIIGAGSSLTIKDEGTPLATAATSLDFVGPGVVASGAGAAKTITISGAPTGAAGGDLAGTYPNPTVAPSAIAALPAAGAHLHVVDEQFSGNASTTVFYLANSAVPDSVMAWVAAARTPVTLGGTLNDEITFGSPPGSGTNNISVDYAAAVA